MGEWRVVQATEVPFPRLRPLGDWLVALTAILLVAQLLQVVLLREIEAFAAPAGSLRLLAITLPFSALALAQLAVALVWMHRASSNVTRFGMQGRQWGPGWAVGSWFIPAANLVLPLFALVEIWKGSDPQADAVTWKSAPFPALLGWMWPLWVATQLLSVGVGAWVGIRGVWIGRAVQAPLGMAIVQMALYVAAGVLFIVFVRRIQQMQELRVAGS